MQDVQNLEFAATGTSPGMGTVLVVEDELSMLQIEEMALNRFGYRVLSAMDGPEGIEVFNSHQNEIDAVILDYRLPGMSGMEVFKRLRKIKPLVPVVFTSGLAPHEIQSHFNGVPKVSILSKPFGLAQLKSVLGGVLPRGSFAGETGPGQTGCPAS